MRAKTRAVAAATGTALVVVPLTGAAAAALVTDDTVADGTRLDAAAYSSDVADIPELTTETKKSAYEIDTPTVKVKVPPPPEPEPEPEPVVVEETTTSTESSTSSSESSDSSSSSESTTSGATEVSSSESTSSSSQSSAVQAAISGSAVIAEASKYVGVPYVSGGSSPSGFDCSGFVSYVYGQLGVSLPRSSGAYYSVGTQVSSPQAGDIIVTPGHVGIYAGPGLQIDAPRPGKTIQFRAIWQSNPQYRRVT
ncbi:C40 family peptidase [Demequina mangrovi]|uniref:Cell wall-associated hydrolase, NlpC family n=1 Tax=Demequina mangrovi TaxID=1043493 RepID=A0A1H6YG33_9MICO|nr:C40 family peptidase [Demequina mangrovi]SEJ37967.1 Cell wall-associated hydrolase, NlpC family [Demequina mangrovi]